MTPPWPRLTPPAFFHSVKIDDVNWRGKNAGYVLASTLVTTPKTSEVHSNVASNGLLLLLDDARAECSLVSV